MAGVVKELVEARLARADREIASALAGSGNGPHSQQLGAIIGEMDWRAEKARTLGEPVVALPRAVGEARREYAPGEPPMNWMFERRVGEARRFLPIPAVALTKAELASEYSALHDELKPLLARYAAAPQPEKLAVITEMGPRLDRYKALENETVNRVSAALREARHERELAAPGSQMGFGY